MPDIRNLPLFAWGDALRTRRALNRRRRRTAVLAAAAIGMITLPAILPPRPLLVWNASASAPIGLYAVAPPRALKRGDIVLVRLPESARALAARRHYLPANVPAIKRIAGVAGDRICARGTEIWIGRSKVAVRLVRDGAGRPLPAWSGCRRLRFDELFLLMTSATASFDSRYFGPVPTANIVGRARLLWPR